MYLSCIRSCRVRHPSTNSCVMQDHMFKFPKTVDISVSSDIDDVFYMYKIYNQLTRPWTLGILMANSGDVSLSISSSAIQ